MNKFEKWKKEVDELLFEKIEMRSDELPDYEYLKAFDDGLQPFEVAPDVIHQAMDCFGLFWEGDDYIGPKVSE